MDRNYLEASGRTVEEAVENALTQMGATSDEVTVTVIKKGRSGILGLGVEEAVVGVQRVAPSMEIGSPRKAPADESSRVGQEVLEELVKLMGLDAEVSLISNATDERPMSFEVKGEDLGLLIGRRGQTLASFQFIARLIVTHRLQSWVPLAVDVENYKKRRLESLRSLALRVADQVRQRRRSFSLEPMPPDERRAIHMALADHPDVTTESVGEGDERKVTILPKRR